jgi:hypothetical protein
VVAEIILIAMTVILAAVMFVLLSGFLKSASVSQKQIGLALEQVNSTTYRVSVAHYDEAIDPSKVAAQVVDPGGVVMAQWLAPIDLDPGPANAIPNPPLLRAQLFDGGDRRLSAGDYFLVGFQPGTVVTGWTVTLSSEESAGSVSWP